MATRNDVLKFKIDIAAPPEEVFSAFTSAAALTEWLCDVADVDAHPGGRLYLWWTGGYYASGEFVDLKPGEQLVFSWHGRGEPGKTQVKVNFKDVDDGTHLVLHHQDLGSGKVWAKARKAIRKGWRTALDNLKSVIESGQDLRLARRPTLGESGLDEVTPELAAQLALPVKAGLRLHGVLEGQGAQQAGLQEGDVIVKVGGRKVRTINDLQAALQPFEAGEKVKVTFYRGGERQSVKVSLSPRELPHIPETAAELAEQMRRTYEELFGALKQVLVGVNDSEAEFRREEADWTVKENLAHLIAAERDTQTWIGRFLEGHEGELWFPTHHRSRLQAIVSSFPQVEDLLGELHRTQQETLALLASLPAEFVARRRSYWRMGYGLLNLATHLRDHLQDIQALLKAARSAALPSKRGTDSRKREGRAELAPSS